MALRNNRPRILQFTCHRKNFEQLAKARDSQDALNIVLEDETGYGILTSLSEF